MDAKTPSAAVVGQVSRPGAGLVAAALSRVGNRLVGPGAIPLALALVTFLVFSPSLKNGFVQWDDGVILLENESYRGLGTEQLWWMVSTQLMGHWVPLTWLTLGLDYVLWGMHPGGYHLTNIVLFALNIPLFYFVALRLLRKATTFGEGALRVSAMAAALFFALHPLRAESVAWVTERRDVLSGLFFLLTVLTYLRACERQGWRHRWLLVGAGAWYVLALTSKGSVMMLPAALVLLDIYPLGRLPGSWREWLRPAALRVWAEKLPFLALGIAGGAITYHAQAVNWFITPLDKYPWTARLGMTGYSLWFYLPKTIAPMALTPLYEMPTQVSLMDPGFLLPGLAALSITGALLAARRRWPAGLAVWTYYAIMLAPVIGIVHSGFQLTHDRYTYLPSFGFALLVGAGAGAVVRAGATGLLRPALARVAALVGVLWLVGLAALTWHQVQIWRDTDGLWRYALESDPNCAICHGNMGVYLFKQGYIGLAKAEFERVLQLRPENKKVQQHLGLTYATMGDFRQALVHYRLALERYPNDPDILNNMAAALIELRRYTEALEHLNRALRVAPNHAIALTNVGVTLAETGHPAQAVRYHRRAIKLKPDAPQPRYWLGRAHLALGERAAARDIYAGLRVLDPRLAGQLGALLVTDW